MKKTRLLLFISIAVLLCLFSFICGYKYSNQQKKEITLSETLRDTRIWNSFVPAKIDQSKQVGICYYGYKNKYNYSLNLFKSKALDAVFYSQWYDDKIIRIADVNIIADGQEWLLYNDQKNTYGIFLSKENGQIGIIKNKQIAYDLDGDMIFDMICDAQSLKSGYIWLNNQWYPIGDFKFYGDKIVLSDGVTWHFSPSSKWTLLD